MNITLTGSLGNIGKPLATELVQKGHNVTVISSSADRQKDIEAIGATAAIGSMDDADFLTTAFTGADAVFCMVPPAGFVEPDRVAFYSRIAHKYAEAITKSGVRRVIHLSTFGADLPTGTGILVGAHRAENILNELKGIQLTHVRPTYFYYNLNTFIGMIKNAGVMVSNYGGEDKILLVSPLDIAAVIAEELVKPSPAEHSVRYIASDVRSANEIASAIGAAIGKPDLKWNVISSEEALKAMLNRGMPEILAKGFVEMFDSQHDGSLAADFYRVEGTPKGKVKLEEAIKDFVAAYNK